MNQHNLSEFDQHALDYDFWFDENPDIFQSELLAIQQAVPENKVGMEVGVGTGRFAQALGIKLGIEPSENMAKVAEQRGIKVLKAFAEHIPLEDSSYDYALMVTTECFLTDIPKAFSEVNRILKPGGDFIIGMIDKNSRLGKKYVPEMWGSKFYRTAHFQSTEEISEFLKQEGFNDFKYWETLVNQNIHKIQKPSPSYGNGGFVVIKATKNKP